MIRHLLEKVFYGPINSKQAGFRMPPGLFQVICRM